jgi:hypothetical protein
MHYGLTPESRGVPAVFRAALDSLGLGWVDVIEMEPGQSMPWGPRR